MRCWKCAIFWSLVAAVVAVLAGPLIAKEARPPKWSRDVLDAFFEDAREKLVGPRPDYGSQAPSPESVPANSTQPVSSGSGIVWSKLIAPDTLESEVKRLNESVARAVTTPSQFKGGGYKDARREFSELAVLFAVTAEYDGDARWKDVAAGLRELFSRAGLRCKDGTDESYREATNCKQELADIVRGNRPQLPKADAAAADWSKIAARPSFRRNQRDVAHEAQIMALVADVIRRESFEFSDDETYVGFAVELQQAASDVSAAAAAGNFEAAREAIGRATNACANCHDGYRG